MGERVKVKHYKFSKLRLFNAAGSLSSPSLPRSSTLPELRLTFPSVLWSPSSHLPQNTRRQRDADQFLCIPPSAWLLISEEKGLLCRVEWGGGPHVEQLSLSRLSAGVTFDPIGRFLTTWWNVKPPSQERTAGLCGAGEWHKRPAVWNSSRRRTRNMNRRSTLLHFICIEKLPLSWNRALALASFPPKGPAIALHVERRIIWGRLI